MSIHTLPYWWVRTMKRSTRGWPFLLCHHSSLDEWLTERKHEWGGVNRVPHSFLLRCLRKVLVWMGSVSSCDCRYPGILGCRLNTCTWLGVLLPLGSLWVYLNSVLRGIASGLYEWGGKGLWVHRLPIKLPHMLRCPIGLHRQAKVKRFGFSGCWWQSIWAKDEVPLHVRSYETASSGRWPSPLPPPPCQC